jgi:hypothetical protein
VFRYFGSSLIGQVVKFRDFLKDIKQCPDFGNISIDKCLTQILRHFESTFPAGRTGRGICILGIDEIIKSCPDDFLALAKSISAVGTWSDQPIEINKQRNFVLIPVITSLSQVLVGNSTQNSGRHIQWIPLPPLEGLSKQVCDLLNVTTRRAQDLIELLCRYLGYHGRLIEIAVDILVDEIEYLEQGPSALGEIISDLKNQGSCRAYLVRFHVEFICWHFDHNVNCCFRAWKARLKKSASLQLCFVEIRSSPTLVRLAALAPLTSCSSMESTSISCPTTISSYLECRCSKCMFGRPD